MKKLKRLLNEKHDYVELNTGFENIISMIDNMNVKTKDFVDTYSAHWVIYITRKEGLSFLFNFPYNILSRMLGKFKYHSNFLESLCFKVEEIDKRFEEKNNMINGQTIGFINKKTRK